MSGYYASLNSYNIEGARAVVIRVTCSDGKKFYCAVPLPSN